MIKNFTAAAAVLAMTATAGLAQTAEQLLDQRASTGGLVAPLEEIVVAPAAAVSSFNPLYAVPLVVVGGCLLLDCFDGDDDDDDATDTTN